MTVPTRGDVSLEDRMSAAHSAASDDSSDQLRHRSEVLMRLRSFKAFHDILIIDDEPSDIRSLTTILKLLQGLDLNVRTAITLGIALDQIRTQRPQLVFLDDWITTTDSADTNIAFLRRCGYDGPIVVVAGQVSRRRRIELEARGAAAVVSKDDFDSTTIAAVLIQVASAEPSSGSPPPAC